MSRAPLSLVQQSYELLRARLFDGELTPGSRLDYKNLSAELGVSPTPLREAVGRLASEGLVDLVPRLGAVVRTLGREEMIELYGIREAIETYAAAQAAARLTQVQLDEISELLEKMDRISKQLAEGGKAALSGVPLRQFLAADLSFHMTIISAAGNSRLTSLAADSHAHIRIFSAHRMEHSVEVVEETQRQHHAIFKALVAREANGARALVAAHIERSLDGALLGFSTETARPWWKS